MKRVTVGVMGVVVACCGGGGKGAPAPTVPPDRGVAAAPPDAGAPARVWPAPPAGFATADLIGVRGGSLVTYAISGGTVTETSTLKLAEVDAEDYGRQLSGEWADRDHFFVLLPPRTVLMVTADAITEVEVPPESAFTTPRPKVEDDEALMENGGGEPSVQFVVVDGAVWWSQCPWGYPFDGWVCEVYVNAQLWPKAELVPYAQPIARRRWRLVEDRPAGFATSIPENAETLECTPPKKAGKKTVLRADTDMQELVDTVTWVSASPPRLLVVFGSYGLDDMYPTRWSLHDGCTEKPLAQGPGVEPGPAGLWIAREKDDPTADEPPARQVLRRGADVLGELPADAEIRFRPPAK